MRTFLAALAFLLVACDSRYPVDDMIITAKKDLGKGWVEYTILAQGDGNANWTTRLNVSTKDNSWQLKDKLRVTKKD